MQNEFEKKMQQKMEEFNLIPSEPVWQKIEVQIQKKKDKRRFLIWIPVLLLLLAGGVWWTNKGNNQNKKALTFYNKEKEPVQNNGGRSIEKGSHINKLHTKSDGNIEASTQRPVVLNNQEANNQMIEHHKAVRPSGTIKNIKHIKELKQGVGATVKQQRTQRRAQKV